MFDEGSHLGVARYPPSLLTDLTMMPKRRSLVLYTHLTETDWLAVNLRVGKILFVTRASPKKDLNNEFVRYRVFISSLLELYTGTRSITRRQTVHELLGMSLTYDRIWMLDQHSSIISEDTSDEK